MYTNNMANRIYALDNVLNRERERMRESSHISLSHTDTHAHTHTVERNYAMDYAFDWGNRGAPKKKRFGLF